MTTIEGTTRTIAWFRDDLRLDDQPMLAAARWNAVAEAASRSSWRRPTRGIATTSERRDER